MTFASDDYFYWIVELIAFKADNIFLYIVGVFKNYQQTQDQ